MKNKKIPLPGQLATNAGNGKDFADEIDVEKYTAILKREREWRRLNPSLWAEIESWALNEAANQRKFAMQTALERIRWKDYTDDAGNPVRVSNDYGAIWARLLVQKHPEIRKFISLRPSAFDHLDVIE